MKSREFVRDYLRPIGAVFLKMSGDHHVYRLPNGETLDVPMGGSRTELAPSVMPMFRRRMRAA